MNIAVLEGSPNKRSSSNLLAEHFIRSVQEAGHTVGAIGAAHAGLRPCTGCVRCSYEGSCTQKGAMGVSRRQIPAADMLVSVTPLYYYGMPAQLKLLAEPLLRHQQQYRPPPHEACAHRRLERGRLDVRRPRRPLPTLV